MMDLNLSQNWPVYLLGGAFIIFVVFAFLNSRRQEKKDKEARNIKENTFEKK